MHSDLQDHDRDILIAPASYWASHLSDSQVIVIASEILDAFERWKMRQVDELGFLRVAPSIHVSSFQELLEPHAYIEPWQCAGPFIRNDIDLAFSLWLDKDPNFGKLIREHGLNAVFSLIGLWSARSAIAESLIRLNGLLVAGLVDDANTHRRRGNRASEKLIAKEQQSRANLERAWEESKRVRSLRADQLRQSVRKAAADYWHHHLLADQNTVIAFLQEGDFKRWSPKTIARLIAGVQGEVRERLKSAHGQRTDLYATGQSRIG